jgi:hypothetical protein
VLIGYFQNWQIVDQKLTNYALNSIWEEFPKNQKNEIQDLIDGCVYKNSVLIHHRLGDYEVDNYFAKLPEQYFMEALNITDRQLTGSKYLIITNDVKRSKELLKHLQDKTYLENERELSPLEWIILGREFKNFVLSNSTFGWWMAFLSENPQSVVYPDPWFKEFKYDIQIAPQEWHRLSWDLRK